MILSHLITMINSNSLRGYAWSRTQVLHDVFIEEFHKGISKINEFVQKVLQNNLRLRWRNT